MTAIGRALMGRPRLLVLDEPSMGLAPKVTDEIYAILVGLNRSEGLTLLVAEQNVALALRHAERCVVLETGRSVLEGPARELRAPRRHPAGLSRPGPGPAWRGHPSRHRRRLIWPWCGRAPIAPRRRAPAAWTARPCATGSIADMAGVVRRRRVDRHARIEALSGSRCRKSGRDPPDLDLGPRLIRLPVADGASRTGPVPSGAPDRTRPRGSCRRPARRHAARSYSAKAEDAPASVRSAASAAARPEYRALNNPCDDSGSMAKAASPAAIQPGPDRVSECAVWGRADAGDRAGRHLRRERREGGMVAGPRLKPVGGPDGRRRRKVRIRVEREKASPLRKARGVPPALGLGLDEGGGQLRPGRLDASLDPAADQPIGHGAAGRESGVRPARATAGIDQERCADRPGSTGMRHVQAPDNRRGA